MTYAEAIQFLCQLQVAGANFGLETSRKLVGLTGNPQEQLRFIHVAGTNGKGSTCAMLESIYRTAGLRVGLFTSPHLVSFRERIQINRELISQADVARLATDLRKLVASFPAEQQPTFFEVVTVMALKYFAEQGCDLVIWETGLGGRLDATNIVTPLASVITNIALDHTQWLGDTLAKIAAEKAGIVKPGIPVITSEDKPEALTVIQRVAEENVSPLTRLESVFPPSAFTAMALLPLSGEHQKQNAALTLATVAVLQKQIPVTVVQIERGLANVTWPGRLQWIEWGSQKFLLDGAHNLAGVRALRTELERQASASGWTLILGVLADKDWQAMCGLLSPLASQILLVPVGSERTAKPEQLAEACRAANPSAQIACYGSLREALSASSTASKVIVTGSLYLVGQALALIDPDFAGLDDERALNEWTVKRASCPGQR